MASGKRRTRCTSSVDHRWSLINRNVGPWTSALALSSELPLGLVSKSGFDTNDRFRSKRYSRSAETSVSAR